MPLKKDINECATNNGNCGQICTNTAGSYSCSCMSGYSLQANGRTCIGMNSHRFLIVMLDRIPYTSLLTDINECANVNGNCAQVCTNTVGSYICSCVTGYELDADTRTCDGK